MQPDERTDGWGVCHELAVAIHRATADWPPGEMYGLAAQARRAAVSAALNASDDPPIADPVHRYRQAGRALRSLHFLGYILILAYELGYLTAESRQALDRLRRRAEALIRSVTPAGMAPRLLQ